MKKIAVITGAGKGIGFVIARQLGLDKCHVVLTSRDREKGIKALEALKSEGVDAEYLPLDVADANSIREFAAAFQEKFAVLDILVNNAGIGIGNHGASDADVHEIREIMETNFYGPLQLIQALIPLIRNSSDGRIINISSGMGAFSEMGGGYPGYRISKTALNSLTVILSHELKESRVKVNSMCPGWVKTSMGGENAPRSVARGAETAVWLALEDNIPSGKFFRDKKEIPW